MAFKWFWNEETEYYDGEINRNTDWGGDASTENTPVSGGRIQEWLKNEINGKYGVIRVSSSINENNFYTLEMFSTKEDEMLYDSDKDTYQDLVTVVPIPISTVQGDAFTAMLRTTLSKDADIVVTDGKLEIPLNYRAIKITQIGNENAGYNGTLIVQSSTNGETWNTVGTIPNVLTSQAPDDTSSFVKVDIGKYLTNGKQYVRVRAQYSYENESGDDKIVSSSNVLVGKSVTKTTLELALRTDFQTPMDTYNTNGAQNNFEVQYTPYGAVKKTLYVEITGSAGVYKTTKDLESTDDGVTTTISVMENSAYGLLTHGIKKVKAWMEAEDGLGNKITSNTLVNRFMMVDGTLTGVERLKPYIMLQNVDAEIVNYTQTEIAQYAVYSPKLNKDNSVTNDGDAINVAFLITDYALSGQEHTKEYIRIGQMAEPKKAISLMMTVEIEPESEADNPAEYLGYFRVRRINDGVSSDFMFESTGEHSYFVKIDNSTAYTPLTGATFFLNPKVRNNSESNPLRVLNARDNNKEVSSRFTNFGLINDGWITAEDGQKVLRIPAGASLEIDLDVFEQFRKTPQSSMSFMIDYKVSNVTDLESPIIDISEGESVFTGLRMNAHDGWLCTASYNSKNDCLFSWREDKRTHLCVNINHSVKPNNGDVYYPTTAQNPNGTLPLARVLINGKIEREIPFNTTNNAEWSTGAGKIVIGNPYADIDIYSIYVYAGKQFEVNEILNRNVLSAKTNAEEKNDIKRRNDILEGGKISVEKAKQLGKNCFIWHGKQPYFYNQSGQKGWLELFRYDESGAYLPEFSGTICKESKALESSGQGSTAKTYYDWNQQDNISKVKYDFATQLNTILVAIEDIHESIVVGAPYMGSIDEDEGKGGKYQGMVVDVYGGNLGKNYPIENKPMQYPYVNGKVMFPDGWIDGNGKYRGRGYQVRADAALSQKNVIKINYASSMQNHLWGACNSYNDLHRIVVGETPLQKVCPTAVSAKQTELFMMFNQQEDGAPIVFRGMGNYGAGKMDKVAWGYVKKLHPMFALIEGSDNNLPMTGFRVPFNKNTAVYSPKDEGWKYNGQISWDFDEGATTDGYTDGWTTDGSNNDDGEVEVPKTNIRDRWAEVHNFIYAHSSNLKFYVGTYEDFIESDVAAKNIDYKYWCTDGDKAFRIYYYNHINQSWAQGGLNIYTGHYMSVKDSAPYAEVYSKWLIDGNRDYEILNQRCIDAIVARMKKWIKYFFNEKSLLFNYTYVPYFLAGTDNCDKNTYYKIMPYAEDFSADAETQEGKAFATWFKNAFGYDFDFANVYQVYMDGDDMDSIFRTNNNSHQTKPYYIDRINNWDDNDADKKSLYEGGGNQLFNFVEKAYNGGEIANMMRTIFVAMTQLIDEGDKIYGEIGIKNSVWGFLYKYFFNAQHYFPEVAYNEQARIRYEFPQLLGFISSGAGARNITPISQSLGSQLENELQYMEQRLIMAASFAGFGAFGGGGEIGIVDANDTFGFTPAAMPDGSGADYVFTVKTHQYLYPAFTIGQSYTQTRHRCKPNTEFTFTMATNVQSSDTGIGICGINYYKSIGNIGDVSITSETLTISGKRLTEFYANPTKIYEGQSAFRPKQIRVEAPQIVTFDIKGAKSVNLNLDLSKQSRLTKIDTTNTQVMKVVFPESTTLKEINLGASNTELKIKNLPNLETIKFEGYDNIRSVVIGENINVNTQDLFTVLWNKNTTLSEAEVHNINWNGVNSGLISWLADVKNPNITGTINIQEPSATTSSIDFELKNKIISVFGNVDDLSSDYSKGLKLIYNTIPLDFISLDGTYWNDGNNFKIVITPSLKKSNNQSYFNFSISNITGNTKVSVDSFTGEVEVISLSKESSFVTISCSVETIIGDNFIESIETEVWDREARVGDYVYQDATFSGEISSQKNIVAVCFYTNPENRKQRLAAALKFIHGPGTSLRPEYKYHWGPCEIKDVLKGIVLLDNPSYNVYNVPQLTDIKGSNSSIKIDESFYRDYENGDADGYKIFSKTEPYGQNYWVTLEENLREYKKGDIIPLGLYNTLLILKHRDIILQDSAFNLEIPVKSSSETLFDSLERCLENIVSQYNEPYYACFYYPSASYGYAYEPIVAGELSPKLKQGKWFLGAQGEVLRYFYELFINEAFNEAVEKGILDIKYPSYAGWHWVILDTSTEIDNYNRGYVRFSPSDSKLVTYPEYKTGVAICVPFVAF